MGLQDYSLYFALGHSVGIAQCLQLSRDQAHCPAFQFNGCEFPRIAQLIDLPTADFQDGLCLLDCTQFLFQISLLRRKLGRNIGVTGVD